MDKLPPGVSGVAFSQYVETRFNLLLVASEKFEKVMDERFKHLEQIVSLGQESAKRAVDKAEAAQHAHNIASNEWRATLNDFKSTLVSRAEFDKFYADFSANKLEVSKIIAAQSGKTSVVDPQMNQLIEEVRRLAAANQNRRGVSEGISSATGVVIVVITIALTALGTYLASRPTPLPNTIYIPAPSVQPTPPQAAPR